MRLQLVLGHDNPLASWLKRLVVTDQQIAAASLEPVFLSWGCQNTKNWFQWLWHRTWTALVEKKGNSIQTMYLRPAVNWAQKHVFL